MENFSESLNKILNVLMPREFPFVEMGIGNRAVSSFHISYIIE